MNFRGMGQNAEAECLCTHTPIHILKPRPPCDGIWKRGLWKFGRS